MRKPSPAPAALDPANGGVYTVEDLRPTKRPGAKGAKGADFNVRGYDANGRLLLHTWHIGESSMQRECETWESRGATRRPFDAKKELLRR